MTPREPGPLWLESIPDREPWRRGRGAICFITFFILLGEAVFLGGSILRRKLQTFLLAVVLGMAACFFLYFIWIGRNWPRWIIAPLFACFGFSSVVWGMSEGDGALFVLGIGGLIFFCYLVLAPSVYAFARHQRERIKLGESLVVGLVLLLVLISFGSGLFAFYSYVIGLEREATGFAATAFDQVFIYHDEEFLQSNLKDEKRAMTPHRFIDRLQNELGEPRSVGKLEQSFTTRLVAHHLWVDGKFRVPVIYDSYNSVWINIEVSRIGEGWQIDHIGWSDNAPKL
ncbi:MAG: hypothetical protein ACREIF_19450 [Chthoniobacterales bacterium]